MLQGKIVDFKILRSHLTGLNTVNVYSYPGGYVTLPWTEYVSLYFNDTPKSEILNSLPRPPLRLQRIASASPTALPQSIRYRALWTQNHIEEI